MIRVEEVGKKIKINDNFHTLGKLLICKKCSSVFEEGEEIVSGKLGHQSSQRVYNPLLIVDANCCGEERLMWLPKYEVASLDDLRKHWPDLKYEE